MITTTSTATTVITSSTATTPSVTTTGTRTTTSTTSMSTTVSTTTVTATPSAVQTTVVPKCHTPTPGEECYENIEWVMTEGIYRHPSWYPGLTASSHFDEVQEELFKKGHGNCQKPCQSTTPSVTTTIFATTTVSTTLATTTATVQTTSVHTCHTSTPGEDCYGNVKWVMTEGIYRHPSWYPGLTASSHFDEVQEELFKKGHGNCQKPCQSTTVSTTQATHKAYKTTTVTALTQC